MTEQISRLDYVSNLRSGLSSTVFEKSLIFDLKKDCIEAPQFDNLIILQTVQNELKRRSVPNYKRLKTIIDSGKKCCVFVNEFSVETHAKRVKGESSNDYNDRNSFTLTCENQI